MRARTPILALTPVLALSLAILPVPVLAEATPLAIDLRGDLPYLDRATVAGGAVWTEWTILADIDGQQLVFNGAPVPGLADIHVHVQAVTPRPGTEGEDIVFVTLAGGGNACPTLWAIVFTSAQGAQATRRFGTCSEAIVNPRLSKEGLLAFDMAPIAEGKPWMTYTVDGADLRETALAAPP